MPTLSDTTTISSCTGEQISRIKSSYEIFCALIWNYPIFAKNSNFLSVKVWFLGHFCMYFISDKDYFPITIINANCDGSVPHVRLHIMS